MESTIRESLAETNRRIAAAARRAGRGPDDVQLVVVTKSRPVEEIRDVLACGAGILGENRIQEALDKIPQLPPETVWHMIGHLQRNKAKQAVGNFAMIHSLDSQRLAEALQRHADDADQTVEVLLEVNVSGEESKFGLAPHEVLPLLKLQATSFDRLRVRGLMTMAPFVDDTEEVRPVFRALCALRDRLRDSGYDLPHLSMGMTNDYEVAIEEGATIVRIGTAIFGPRSYA
jgi:pyridoxal phosphate enzyme (YggS family)